MSMLLEDKDRVIHPAAESDSPCQVEHSQRSAHPPPATSFRVETWLWLILPVAFLIASWAWRLQTNNYWLSGDDPPRLNMAAIWRDAPFFAPDDTYWLPLPIWLYGSVLIPGWEFSPWLHTLPSVIFMTAFLLVLGWPEGRSPGSGHVPLWGPFTAAAALCASGLSGLSASVLSEPLVLFLQALALRALISTSTHWSRPLLLSGACALGGMCRYEFWLLGVLLWSLYWTSRIFSDGFSGRGGSRNLLGRLDRRSALLLPLSGFLVIGFPIAWLIMNQLQQGDWLQPFRHSQSHALHLTPRQQLESWVSWTFGALPLLITAFVFAGIGTLAAHRRLLPLAATAACALPLMMALAGGHVGNSTPQRFGLPTVVALLMCAGAGFSSIRARLASAAPRLLRPVMAATIITLLVLVVSSEQKSPRYPLPDLRTDASSFRTTLPSSSLVLILDYDGEQGDLGLQLFQAVLPRQNLTRGGWISSPRPLSPEALRTQKIRFVIHRDPETLAAFTSAPPSRVERWSSGWRLASF